MYDRIPSPGKENRVSITQDNGQVITGVLAYADDATQEGSAYTKGNVLPDDVCMLMGLDPDLSEPDDAFRYLALMNATVYGGIAIRVISNGLPLSGITFSVTGTGSVTTDSQGYVFLRKPPGNYTATFTSTLDLVFSPASFQVTATAGQINSYTVEADEASVTQRTFTSSTTISFSDRVSDFDVFAVGGGGAGGCAFVLGGTIGAACGGAGGYTDTTLGVSYNGQLITISIGAGGTAATLTMTSTSTGLKNYKGGDGGETTVKLGGSTICQAAGGDGGISLYNDQYSAGRDGANGGSGSGAVASEAAGSAGSNGSSGGDARGSSGVSYSGGTGQGTNTRPFGGSSGTSYSPAGESASVRIDSRGRVIVDEGGSASGGGSAGTGQIGSASGTVTGKSGSTRGSGGGGAVLAKTGSQTTGLSLTVTSGAGTGGVVIIRWRYK